MKVVLGVETGGEGRSAFPFSGKATVKENKGASPEKEPRMNEDGKRRRNEMENHRSRKRVSINTQRSKSVIKLVFISIAIVNI